MRIDPKTPIWVVADPGPDSSPAAVSVLAFFRGAVASAAFTRLGFTINLP